MWEGFYVNDRAVGLLEQYEVEVYRTRKGRGAIVCDTDRGVLVFKEYIGSEEKLAFQDKILQGLKQSGVETEQLLPDKEGNLFVKDFDETKYVLKTWCEGRECNIYDRSECVAAVRLLARLHKALEATSLETENVLPQISPGDEYARHNRELKRVRNFLTKKGNKTPFETYLRGALDEFLEQAQMVTAQWESYAHLSTEQPESKALCHGDYQYHNVVCGESDWWIANFEKCVRDNPVRDLYLFMRKLLEKSNWSVALGSELLQAYESERPISAYSRIDLYYRLAYPEKFWKIANFYYNSGKAWIPQRNLEKLDKLLIQEPQRQAFLDTVFRTL